MNERSISSNRRLAQVRLVLKTALENSRALTTTATTGETMSTEDKSPAPMYRSASMRCPECCALALQPHIAGCKAGAAGLIHPVMVTRDESGFFIHPGVPDLDEDEAVWQAWKTAQGLEVTYAMLEHEDDEHPAYARYFEEANPNVSDWNPTPPDGAGWFTLSIHDTEDGPAWVWARRVARADVGSSDVRGTK